MRPEGVRVLRRERRDAWKGQSNKRREKDMTRYESAKREAWRVLSQLGEQPTREMLRELLEATDEQLETAIDIGYEQGHDDGYDAAIDERSDEVANGQVMAFQVLSRYL